MVQSWFQHFPSALTDLKNVNFKSCITGWAFGDFRISNVYKFKISAPNSIIEVEAMNINVCLKCVSDLVTNQKFGISVSIL